MVKTEKKRAKRQNTPGKKKRVEKRGRTKSAERIVSRIDWPLVGKIVVGGIFVAALSGKLGPKAYVLANIAKKVGTGGLV